MSNVSSKLNKVRQRIQTRAYAVICLILALAVGYYSYSNLTKYLELRNGLQENEALASSLKSTVASKKAEYDQNKGDFDALRSNIERNLKEIFPSEEDYTVLTKKMDDIEQELSKPTNPFVVSSIDFQKPIEDENYSVLPFRMTIRSSASNFNRFMHLIENSGALGSQLRLMEIASIRLSFENNEEARTDREKIISFSVQINAYFQ